MKSIEILMAEDSPSDAELAREALINGKLSNKLNVVTNGQEALDYLHKRGKFASANTPDLILLDINMPIKNGFEVLTELKADEKLRRIPVVVLTTSEDEHDVLKSYDLQAACFITKPVNFTKFQDIVKQLKNFWFSVVTLPPNGR
ncbi:MAG TPA: response regulator [Planktothrix sp.]|jgi:two-component system response regulator